MEQFKKVIGLSFCIALAGCKMTTPVNINTGSPLDSYPVVAIRMHTGDETLVVADQKLMKENETVLMPLSHLAEELQIVKLDDSEDALVGTTFPVISDNYILVWGQRQNPFKLFDKNGKFITTIGSFGQGPNEYQNIYDAQIDETNNRIYLLPWFLPKIFVYDLQGNAYEPIPLCYDPPKGKMYIHPDGKTLSVALLPFEDKEAIVWTQDFQGNLINSIKPGHLSLPFDFSNEVLSDQNTGSFDLTFLCIVPESRPDSLYHYDTVNNRLIPQFTMNYLETPAPWHGYGELSDYFFGDISYPEKIAENVTQGVHSGHYMVNKRSLKGGNVKFVNDYLGNIDMWPSFRNGYYAANYEPAIFMEILDDALTKKTFPEKMQEKLLDIRNSMNENDNNYIIYARLKDENSK